MDDDSKRHEGGTHEGTSSRSPYPLSRMAPAFDLVDVAKQIARADSLIGTVTGSKLQLIAEQIQRLQGQAREILEKAQQDAELHRARCQLQKRPGQIYHLYARPDGQVYLSLLTPEDWRGAPPHSYRGSYRLESDMSWTAVDPAQPDAGSQDDAATWLRNLLGSDTK